MAATGTVGISRLVLQNREHAVMLEPRGKGIILWTLRFGDEVRDGGEVFENARSQKPEAKSLRMIKKLITTGKASWSAKLVADPVEARLAEIVAAKKKAAGRKKKEPAGKSRDRAKRAETEGNVVSIFDALRRSVESEKKR